MSVHIFAFSVVIVQDMRCFESEDFGNANHLAKIGKVREVKRKLEARSVMQ